MKHLKRFDESIFTKKKEEISGDLIPKGFKSSVPRPEWSYEKPEVKKGGIEAKVDPYFLQEISDRLYGPDSEKYINALMDLHNQKDDNGELLYKPRLGRYGTQFYDPKND